MKASISFSTSLILAVAFVCGVVEGHEHGPGHHHAGEAEVPLHEQPFVQDSAEELERKWSFEVSYVLLLQYSSENRVTMSEEVHPLLYIIVPQIYLF
jgi:hypothetical protein